MVYNLVHNAIKFTPEGGSIYVGLEIVPAAKLSELLPKDDELKKKKSLDKESLLLTVADDGEGILPAHLKSIFAKFHQGRGPSGDQSTRGRGLGLSIVKALVEAHGGLVWVESEPGVGSTFRVMLPKLSRKTYLVQTVTARLERVKIVAWSLTLVIFRVVPKIGRSRSKIQDGNLMVDLLKLAVETGQSTVRLKSYTVEILDSSRGVFMHLAKLDPKYAPALLGRFVFSLKKQAEKKGLPLTWQLMGYGQLSKRCKYSSRDGWNCNTGCLGSRGRGDQVRAVSNRIRRFRLDCSNQIIAGWMGQCSHTTVGAESIGYRFPEP